MKDLLEYIYEAANSNDAKSFFKAWKKFRNSGSAGEKLYTIVDGWTKEFNLTLLDENNLEQPTTQSMMTLLLSKKQKHHLLDIAITIPGKKSELEGVATINNDEMELIDSISKYDKWRKGYRGITTLQFAFPHGFFDRVRSNLGDKLLI